MAARFPILGSIDALRNRSLAVSTAVMAPTTCVGASVAMGVGRGVTVAVAGGLDVRGGGVAVAVGKTGVGVGGIGDGVRDGGNVEAFSVGGWVGVGVA
jgi:hypothetical protein